MKRFTAFLACVLAFLSLAATFASAQKSLECDNVWSGPSNSNDLFDCLKDTDRIRSQWQYYLWPGFSVIILLFIVFGITIVCCYRCCCCCCCTYCCVECVNPQEEAHRASARCSLWLWVIFALLWAMGTCVVIILGADALMKAARSAINDMEANSLQYINNTKVTVDALLADASAHNTNVDLSIMDDIITEFGGILSTIKGYFTYFQTVRIVTYCVGAVGVALMLLVAVFAACRAGSGCSVCFSFLYGLFAFAFSLCAIALTVVVYALTASCGEVHLQFTRDPGILQWFVVPWCEDTFNLTSLHVQLKESVVNASESACAELLTYCDATDETYDASSDDKRNRIFMCGRAITKKTECMDLDTVVEVINATYAKPVLTNMLCVNAQLTNNELHTCTLERCATDCVNYDTPSIQAKSWSTSVVNSAAFAENATRAFSLVEPILSCQYIVDNLASNFENPFISGGKNCSALRSSSIMLATGFFVGALMFIAGIYVLHRGSWIWPENRGEDMRDK
ncbi:hypothetical protein STCU_07727 [Strigomonas culicis]|uniref:Uncharacterized protein n=2 Tax=Strigomonas culicis TaxID=28005 RepID=S9VJK0_9TRYP|nr:hypothetical protein STCU_07727 [Strigomonas culicis]|eukprot:EPY23405.1 hypothetical protein STCU_07727 [Strigomonas culicis]